MVRIFLSSTSEDLAAHRARLMETLRRMQLDGMGMEAFGADPAAPVELCKREVDKADLVVLVLAHRYGWVPSQAQGGDGTSSITRIEFDQACRPSSGPAKPVLAFVVDEKAEWTAGREQDALVHATSPAQALTIFHAVQALKQFKAEVSALFVRDTFTTPADLADKVGSAVGNWLRAEAAAQPIVKAAAAQQQLQELFDKVATQLRQGQHDTALMYLERGAEIADPSNQSAIADKRLEIASAHLSLHEERLLQAASEVWRRQGHERALAALLLGKTKSQRARATWDVGSHDQAWAWASEARQHFADAAAADELNPDVFGSLGGLLKRMAQWARALHREEATALEDAMLSAYETGWRSVPDAYPLLNYIERRAVLAAQRDPSAGARELIAKDELPLRVALKQALKTREGQLGNRQDRPWAAFDLARGRHYLSPNVPAFLEDLSAGLDEARSVARTTGDRYMVQNTCDSLRDLLAANVHLEGLAEGLALLERGIADEDWFIERPRSARPYLEHELQQLQALLIDLAQQQLRLSAQQLEQVARFIKATELRWSRDDEARFQAELVQWKRDLEPAELKILRGVWKVFGAKALGAFTGGIPVDWNAALELVQKQSTR